MLPSHLFPLTQPFITPCPHACVPSFSLLSSFPPCLTLTPSLGPFSSHAACLPPSPSPLPDDEVASEDDLEKNMERRVAAMVGRERQWLSDEQARREVGCMTHSRGVQ